MNGWHNAPAELPTKKRPLVPSGYKTGWALQPVWMLWHRWRPDRVSLTADAMEASCVTSWNFNSATFQEGRVHKKSCKLERSWAMTCSPVDVHGCFEGILCSHVPPKRWHISTGLYGVTSHKTVVLHCIYMIKYYLYFLNVTIYINFLIINKRRNLHHTAHLWFSYNSHNKQRLFH
jgi:hypothetical protein